MLDLLAKNKSLRVRFRRSHILDYNVRIPFRCPIFKENGFF